MDKEQKIKENLKNIQKETAGFFGEFKKFIAKGNVMDLAVGVIIGTAFSNIVKSLTDNILMPLIGVIVGGYDFTVLSLPLKIGKEAVDLKYGLFVQSTVDFLLTAFCIFVMVKILNSFFKKKEEVVEEKPAEPVKTNEELLLEEIRDLLKEQNKKTSK